MPKPKLVCIIEIKGVKIKIYDPNQLDLILSKLNLSNSNNIKNNEKIEVKKEEKIEVKKDTNIIYNNVVTEKKTGLDFIDNNPWLNVLSKRK